MGKITATITAVGGYVPDQVFTNDDLSKFVDTNDEWMIVTIGAEIVLDLKRISSNAAGSK